MSDNVAILAGFTEEYMADCPVSTFPILVKPGTDLDSRFKAWDMDAQEFIMINGWVCTFERQEAQS